MTVFIKAKKALVRKLAFFKQLPNLLKLLNNSHGSFHTKVIEKVEAQALMTQETTEAPNSNKINFQILQILWSQEKVQIVNIVYHAI